MKKIFPILIVVVFTGFFVGTVFAQDVVRLAELPHKKCYPKDD